MTESRWIGVNTEVLTGDIQAGKIGVNTELLTEENGHTKWIGVNTHYITELIQTATISGAPTTITAFPNVQVIGSLDSNGHPKGPLDIVMAPALVAQIQALADEMCPKAANGQKICSPDFAPRVQSLLKGGTALTERGLEAFVAPIVGFMWWAVRTLIALDPLYSFVNYY